MESDDIIYTGKELSGWAVKGRYSGSQREAGEENRESAMGRKQTCKEARSELDRGEEQYRLAVLVGQLIGLENSWKVQVSQDVLLV